MGTRLAVVGIVVVALLSPACLSFRCWDRDGYGIDASWRDDGLAEYVAVNGDPPRGDPSLPNPGSRFPEATALSRLEWFSPERFVFSANFFSAGLGLQPILTAGVSADDDPSAVRTRAHEFIEALAKVDTDAAGPVVSDWLGDLEAEQEPGRRDGTGFVPMLSVELPFPARLRELYDSLPEGETPHERGGWSFTWEVSRQSWSGKTADEDPLWVSLNANADGYAHATVTHPTEKFGEDEMTAAISETLALDQLPASNFTGLETRRYDCR